MSFFTRKGYSRVLTITSAAILLTTSSASIALARPGFNGRPVPPGHSVIHVGPLSYFFLGGLFYMHSPKGLIVAPAPVGAVIHSLPPRTNVVNIDGVPYYTCSGIYYKQISEGYLVVSQPVKQVEPEIALGQKLQVSVELLNVRSGPSLSHEIVQQLSKDTVVIVEALSSNWCLVRLDEKTSGWINSNYTTVLAGSAKG